MASFLLGIPEKREALFSEKIIDHSPPGIIQKAAALKRPPQGAREKVKNVKETEK